jgi:hypothetical protein
MEKMLNRIWMKFMLQSFLWCLLDQENGTTSFVSCFWCKEIDLFRHSPRLYHQDFHTLTTIFSAGWLKFCVLFFRGKGYYW